MDSKVVFKRTAHLAVTAGLAASMTLGSFPLAVFADATEPAQKPAAEQEAPKAEEGAVEEQVPAVEETQPTPAAEEAVSTAANSAADAEAEVNELQQAVNNASNGQLTLSKDYSFESPTIITVGSNLAITGANHKLHNVVFKVVSASFEVKNAVFSGKSRVWDSSATSIKVSGCTMNVDLGTIDGVAAGWGLHAFVCGTNEANGTHKLKVVIEDNTLTSTNSDGGFGLFYDWALLTGTGNSISRNTIGSTDKPLKLDNGFDPKNEVGAAITIMNGDNGAQVKIDGNNIFASTDRRAVVVYQNCSRQNTYTATFSGNELHNTVAAAAFAKVFANADKAGMDNGNKAHLRAVFLDNNTINGETVSFDNVDVTDATGNTTAGQYGLIATGVKLDQSGKMTAGIVKLGTTTVTNFNKDIAAADNKLPAKPNADGTYKVEAKYVAQVGTAKYETLNAAIDAANKATDVDSVTIDLLADTKMDATAGISKKIILNGNGHQLNGQLAFRAESDGSKVQNVHFVFDKDTKFASGDWASNIRIEKADNVEITGNQFRMTKDAAKHAGKSIAVHVFPNGVSVSGTKITGNKFDIEYADGNFGIFLSNEINSGANTLTNTLVDNNTFVAHKDAATEAYFLVAYDKNSRQGVQEVTVTNNHIADGGDAKKGVLLGIWGGVDGMTLQGNTFGAGEIGVEFMQDTRWGNTLPSTDIDIKGNTFNTSTAVKDSGAFRAKDPSNQNWEKVPTSGNGIADGSLNYVEYEGNDANIFGPNTVPFQNRSLDNNSYGTVFYDVDGVTLLDWQVVENGEAPQDKKVGEKPGYASTWYTDAEGKNAYDFKSDASKDGLLKLYLKRTPIEYKVSYDLDGGVNAKENPATFTVESNEIELAAPTRDGYDFAGWVDKGGKKVEKIAAGTVGDIALKATWTKKAEPVANHTVTFVDGLGNKATQTVTDGGKAVAPVDPEHDGWEFVGWYTSEDFKDLYDFDTPVTGDLTLYGGWRKAGSDKVTEPEGEQKPDTQKPADKKADDKALPQTGDNSALPVAVVAGAGVAAIAAGAVVSKRRKQE